MGDSWAFFQNVDGTIRTIAKDWGHSDVDYYTNLTLSENGAKTKDFLKPDKISELATQLQSKPEIKVIHLSIAGNDFLGDWKRTFTQAQTDSLADLMISRLDSLIDTIQFFRPGITVFWPGYVYTNFRENIEKLPSFLQSQHPFYSTWQKMGFPSFQELNDVQNWFQSRVETHNQNRPYFHYVHATGLMQYEFGQETPLNSPPNGSYPKYTAPMPEGYPEYPSPEKSMRHYAELAGIEIIDCFHLSAKGYRYYNSYQFRKFYHRFLMDDAYTIADKSRTGSVSSSGAISNELKVGKNGSEEYVGIINFDNMHMVDTGASKAQLFIRIDEIQGDNFLTDGNFVVEVMDNHFGTSASLEVADFDAVSAASADACVFGNPDESEKWVRLDLNSALLPYIYRNNIQFRIRYTGNSSVIKFTNSDEEDFQPILNMVYGGEAHHVGVENVQDVQLAVYPNPAKEMVIIEANQPILDVKLLDITGKEVSVDMINQNQMDISRIPQGIYFVKVQFANQVKDVKIIKN